MSAAIRLPPNRTSPHKNENSFKYHINCQERIQENPETKSWLELESKFEHDSPDYKIYKALLDKRQQIVAKIGRAPIDSEYKIGKFLETLHLPTVLPFHCHFSCIDDFSAMNDTTKYICKEKGNPIHVLIMPYVSGKEIQNYAWNRQTFAQLKNVMKHIILTALYISKETGIYHADLHLGNILVKKTQRQEISYGGLGTLALEGYIPIFMDYDRSKKEEQSRGVYYDLRRYFLLCTAENEILFDSSKFIRKLEDLYAAAITITPRIAEELCKEIDALEIIRLKSERPPTPNWLKPSKAR